MNRLPSIAKQRLGIALCSEPHPDAGVLTAFVEQTLAGSKRDQTLRHLALCARCNEWVALAAPQPDEMIPVTVPNRNWSSLNFRPWRWVVGTAAAGAVALGAVWMMNPVLQGPSAPASAPATVSSKAPSQTATPSTVARSTTTPRIVDTAKKSTVADAGLVRQPTHLANSNPKGEILGPHAAEVTMQLPPPDPSSEATVPNSSAQAPAPMTIVAAPAAGPCWRVSDAGALEKSLSCAEGWESVPLPQTVVVRVVQSVGNSLWVGGNGGTLYHSVDGGQNWNKVSVPSLSGDIVAIAFGTPTHGWFSTSSGENWMTADGGLTWSRR